jgi:hypothetical protein
MRKSRLNISLALSFVFLAMGSLCSLANAQCFDSQTVAFRLTSENEKSFSFQPTMHVCDETGDPTGTISKAYVSVVQEEATAMPQGRPNSVARVYFELNYDYYNGSGTWAGWQPIILTVQDMNQQELLPEPIYNDNTERDACHYGTAIHARHRNSLNIIFNEIAFVTMQVPRVAVVPHQC